MQTSGTFAMLLINTSHFLPADIIAYAFLLRYVLLNFENKNAANPYE